MDNFLQVILLGIIEGITEFLPISSTGHLLIAQHWLGRRSELFTVAIQAGAILAVVVIYWRRLWNLTINFSDPVNRDYLYKLSWAFIVTVIGGFTAKQVGLELPETVAPIAWALIVGGIVIFAVEAYADRQPVRDTLTWGVATWVGLAQILAAVFPGTSRSAATIFAAMLAGMTSRPAAAEFAFLVGIPTMFAATAYEVLKLYGAGQLANENFGDLALGFVVSAIVAFIAVKWLLQYIQTHRFTVFAWYRIALGILLLVAV
ncbi:undecaprenyl-diphosphatase [Steroidobacter agaridevorans]|uniref:Undecaprenyl-diphosphatase n=1 Tax=Steroidobacter agaridevorans TaxID=2695856 RepID=A0A829YPI7_9GAMM|nr:undecaprenyl-diphosphate phosphatase [Steroidobacter agaridevorans]GFE84723.1 undecaprenyl-diphosphatase [Steroidobacter agaridevorans]GFE86381.1 undecaprenyl-diphosphatase [Steroidobacter agaridevorans]